MRQKQKKRGGWTNKSVHKTIPRTSETRSLRLESIELSSVPDRDGAMVGPRVRLRMRNTNYAVYNTCEGFFVFFLRYIQWTLAVALTYFTATIGLSTQRFSQVYDQSFGQNPCKYSYNKIRSFHIFSSSLRNLCLAYLI